MSEKRPIRSLVTRLGDLVEGDAENRARERSAGAASEDDPRAIAALVRRMSDDEAKQWLLRHRWHDVVDRGVEMLQHWATSDVSPKIRDEFSREKLRDLWHRGPGDETVAPPRFRGGESWSFNATLRDVDDPDVKKSRTGIEYVYLLGPHGWIEFQLGFDEQKVDALFKKLEAEVIDWLNKSKFRFGGTWEVAHHWRFAQGGRSWTHATPTSIQFSLRFRQPVAPATVLGIISLA